MEIDIVGDEIERRRVVVHALPRKGETLCQPNGIRRKVDRIIHPTKDPHHPGIEPPVVVLGEEIDR